MHGLQDLAIVATTFASLLWLYLHPSKHQRERAVRSQQLHDWDWRS